MQRLFTDHILRKTESLNGTWNFRIDPENRGLDEKWYLGLKDAEPVAVPSVWNTQFSLLQYCGAAWYEKKFHTEGGCLRFCFEGVMTEADVWLDGVHLGYHYGGFCQFDFIVENVEPGIHTLTVRADNHFDEHSVPQANVDWYHYGGITRSVSVETLKGICALNNRMEYTLSEDLKTAEAFFVLELYNAADAETASDLTVTLDGKQVFAENVTLSGREKKEIRTPAFTVSNVRLWDMEKPELYEIAITTDTDDLLDRTGLRLIEVKNQKIYLNGREIEIRGVNRHEEHPDWGMAFPQGLMKRDLDIAFHMGCNSIRGSHYPNSQVFVDMLDGQGMTFWSEIPIWGSGFPAETLADPIVLERTLEMHREMVKYYYNHPCIIIWGMHNEIPSNTQEGYVMSELFYKFLKEHGGNRLVTFATKLPFTDICLEFCDIICINRYLGWYYNKREEWAEEVENFRARRKELGLEEKPVIYSEFGCAAVYGHHTFDDLKWTEEYQANLLSSCLHLFHNDPMVVGTYFWQFCDIRTAEEKGLNRARSFNNKGVMNEYRRPKMSFYAVQQAYRAFAKEEETK